MSGNFLKKLQKQFEDITTAVDSNYTLVPYYIPSGSLVLNWILSNNFFNGYPVGRVIEIFGESGQGKSTIGIDFLANIQQMGGIAIIDDTEGAYSQEYGQVLGIDNSKLIYTRSETVEDVRDKILKYIDVFKDRDEKIPVGILVDSIGRLTTIHERENVDKVDYSKSKELNKLIRVCSGPCERYEITIMLLNHVYTDMSGYITKKETPGGRGVKYLSSIRLDIRRKPIIDKQKKIQVGTTVFIKCIKNNISPEGRNGDFDIYHKDGIAKYSGLISGPPKTGNDQEKRGPGLLQRLEIIEKVEGSYMFRFTTVEDEVRFKRTEPEEFQRLITERPELLTVSY